MTKIILLEELKKFTLEATRELLLPVAFQKGDPEPPAPRAPEVHLMRLPSESAWKKKAPYITHQVLQWLDVRNPGRPPVARAVVRSYFCVYNQNESEGELSLLNLMERLRIALLEAGRLGRVFTLDLDDTPNKEAGLEGMIYPNNIVPYYKGEMMTAWYLPPVERKVNHYGEGNGNVERPEPGPRCRGGKPGYGENAPHEGGEGR